MCVCVCVLACVCLRGYGCVLLFFHLQDFADSLNVTLLETSAKNAKNVEETFFTMAADLKRTMGDAATPKPKPNVVTVDETQPLGGKEKGSCC